MYHSLRHRWICTLNHRMNKLVKSTSNRRISCNHPVRATQGTDQHQCCQNTGAGSIGSGDCGGRQRRVGVARAAGRRIAFASSTSAACHWSRTVLDEVGGDDFERRHLLANTGSSIPGAVHIPLATAGIPTRLTATLLCCGLGGGVEIRLDLVVQPGRDLGTGGKEAREGGFETAS